MSKVTPIKESHSHSGSPLRGIKVLELGQFISGPMAGQMLADLGADVIKVERPGGDPFRVYDHCYAAFNRNKRGIVVDLKRPEGCEVVRRLARETDVVIENFRPGVLARLGLGTAELQAANPQLIYCSISGFSADGPYRDFPAFDTLGQGLSGMLSLFVDEHNPRLKGPTIADQATALQAANAVTAALFARERGGSGAHVEVSMLDATLAFMPDAFTAHTDSGLEVGPETRVSYSHSFVFSCADGRQICVHVGGPNRFWLALVEAVESEEIASNPLFEDRKGRIANFPTLVDAFSRAFARRSSGEWLERMRRHDVPASQVYRVSEVLSDPEVRHAGIFSQAHHPVLGPMTVMRRAVRIDSRRDEARRFPPMLGEHSREVLLEAGYSSLEVNDLCAGGVVTAPESQPSESTQEEPAAL